MSSALVMTPVAVVTVVIIFVTQPKMEMFWYIRLERDFFLGRLRRLAPR
jgi:hypothetical protein